MLMLTDICTGSPDYGFSASGKVAGRYRFARITDIDPLGRLKKNDAKFVDSDGGKILKENDDVPTDCKINDVWFLKGAYDFI